MAAIQAAYIDDEQPLLEIAKAFLESEGDLKLDVFEVPWDAFSALTDRGYDVVVCDYQMPGMDGIEVLKTLRENGSHVPFILFTGKGREEVAMEALNLGADRYIQKGGDPKSQFVELKHAVKQLHQRTQAVTELEQSNRRLEVLYRATEEMVGSFNLEQIGETIYQAVSKVMDADIVIISSHDMKTKTIRTEAAWENGHELDISHFPPTPVEKEGHGTLSQVIHSGRPLLIPDLISLMHGAHAESDPEIDFRTRDRMPVDEPMRIRSAVMVPLKRDSDVIGILSVMSRREGAYSEKDLHFLEPLSGSAAAAISLGRMHQQANLELDRRGQVEHQRLLLEAMIEASENGIMILHIAPGSEDIRPIIWNPAAVQCLFGGEGRKFTTLKECSDLLDQDLEFLAKEVNQKGVQVKVLAVRERARERQLLEICVTPLDSEHVGLLMAPK